MRTVVSLDRTVLRSAQCAQKTHLGPNIPQRYEDSVSIGIGREKHRLWEASVD